MNSAKIRWCLISVLCFLLCLVYTNDAFAEDVHGYDVMDGLDSKSVSQTVLDAINATDADDVFKAYNIPIVYAFADYNTIEEVLTSQYVNQIIYVLVNDQGDILTYETRNDSQPVILQDSPFKKDVRSLSEFFNGNAIRKISNDIKVNNVYYLWGRTNHQGTALYYETNMGDYVYYGDDLTGREYLLPAGDFVDYMRSMYSKMGPDTPPGGDSLTSDWDMSKYDINSTTFDPASIISADDKGGDVEVWILAAIGVGILLAGIAVGVGFRRRNVQNIAGSD